MTTTAWLRIASDNLAKLSSSLKAAHQCTADGRALRAELMLEELSEALDALAKRDEVQLLDATADLTYVAVGTAVAYGLPFDAAFAEVHSSNMTKLPKLDHSAGNKGKGRTYRAPDLAAVIERERKK